MYKIICLFIALLCALPVFAREKFEPPDGYILNGAGADDLQANGGPTWNSETFVPFYNSMPAGSKPVINAFYTTIDTTNWADGVYMSQLQAIFAQTSSYQIPEIDVNLNHYQGASVGSVGLDDQIAAGAFDTQIHQMGALLKALNRPVFLRIGGEMNNPLQGYHVGSFATAWRRIVDLLRGDGVTNVAYVWCVVPDNNTWDAWYPGDSYVNWFAIDVYYSPDANATSFVNEAAAHGKPVMIPESGPAFNGANSGVGAGATSWNAWFAGFFSWIYAHPNIKALIYVNMNYPVVFPASGAPDCLLEDDAYVLSQYIAQVNQTKWIGSQSEQQVNLALGIGGGATSSYGGPGTAIAGVPVSLSGSGNTTYGSVSTYRWAFINGPVAPVLASPMSQTTQATFPVPGTYNMAFLVTDTQGYTSETDFGITVSPIASIGTGDFIFGFHFPNSSAVAANVSALAPDGSTFNGRCASSPCTITLGKAAGSAVVNVYYLNAGDQQVASTGPIIMPIGKTK